MIDIKTILTHSFAILLGVLVFYLSILVINRLLRKSLSTSHATWTIEFAIAGLVLHFAASSSGIAGNPAYLHIVEVIESILVMACIASVLNYLVTDVYIFFKTKKRPPNIVRDLVSISIYSLFVILSLRIIFMVEVSSLVTTSAVLTAAIAFAMQGTLANIASGFAIQLDKNLKRKTWIYIKDKDITGEIVNVGVRYTTLRNRENILIMVPNIVLVQSVVKNMGHRENIEKTALAPLVSLGYELPPEKAINLISETLDFNPYVLKDPEPQIFVENYADSSIQYRVRFYISDYTISDTIRSSFLSSLWYAVIRHGYSFPYPHLELIKKSPEHPITISRDIVLQRLRNVEIFANLSPDDQALVTSKAHIKVYAPSEAVIRQDDEGDSLFIVNSGLLDVLINTAKVATLTEGEFFGEMSLLTGERRGATIVAQTEAWLIEISKETIEPVIRNNPELLQTLSAILAARAEKNRQHLDSMAERAARTDSEDDLLMRLKQFFGF